MPDMRAVDPPGYRQFRKKLVDNEGEWVQGTDEGPEIYYKRVRRGVEMIVKDEGGVWAWDVGNMNRRGPDWMVKGESPSKEEAMAAAEAALPQVAPPPKSATAYDKGYAEGYEDAVKDITR